MKNIIYLIVCIFFTNNTGAQNIEYAHSVIDKLASPEFHGRGYTKNGAAKAAKYIANEMNSAGLKSYSKNYYQTFNLNINTIKKANIVIDSEELTMGLDYLPELISGSAKGTYLIEYLDAATLSDSAGLVRFFSKPLENRFIAMEMPENASSEVRDFYYGMLYSNPVHAAGFITVKKKGLSATPSTIALSYPVVSILAEYISPDSKKIEIDIANRYLKNYETQNVIGYIEGKTDDAIVVSAHYDHVGRMSKDVYFPGAHDNASGVATMLNIAKHYATNDEKPHYTLVFMAFGAEEAGLLGSKYYTNNPLFPLHKIRFLLNLDLLGSGEEGIQVVNGTVFKKEFELLTDINKNNQYVKAVKRRGEAANSDHYYFYAKGVPAFFVYTLGEYKEYHNIHDKADAVPLMEYKDLFLLFTGFIENL